MAESLIFLGPSGVTLDLAQARCRQPENLRWFFTVGNEVANETKAREICNGAGGRNPCPIKAACLRYAMKLPANTQGVLAGLNTEERKNRRRAEARNAKQRRQIDDWVAAQQQRLQRPALHVAELPPPPPPAAPVVHRSRPSLPPRALKKPRLELLLDYLGRTAGTVYVEGDATLERLAKAIGFDCWDKAVGFFDRLSTEGVAHYSYLRRSLRVNCGLAQDRLLRDERTRQLGDKLVRRNATDRKSQPGAPQRQSA